MSARGMKAQVKAMLPKSLLRVYRLVLSTLRHPADISSVLAFIFRPHPRLSFVHRLSIIRRFYLISYAVSSPHSQEEMLRILEAVLSIPAEVPGCVVEAGCFKGGSTSKLSIAAKIAGRELVVFDSFEGMPAHDEPHDRTIWGTEFHEGFSLAKGTYCGALEEVKANVGHFGHLEVCRFVKGWFDDTLPHFHEPVAVAYLDVDLASSTRTCLTFLYPLLVPNAVVFSQDAHFPRVRELLEDERFWTAEVGVPKPRINGLGQRRLVWMTKPGDTLVEGWALRARAGQATVP